MNTQMVTVTDIQRNFKHILDNLVPKNPTVVLRDSVAEAVIISFSEYKRLANLEKELLKNEMFAMMDEMHDKNKHFTDEEIDRDIEYAKKHAPRSN
ncbi:hypothetical protein A2130_04975 [Candidatus Woesebacteria bacterium GWC2_33_12]|uniref:Uncharacterized protein n=1 Tax=Candidatus Woesebacteria bacterium GW2011_GWB1_33_22 TaxID=1618566 RepID=A0A0G0C0F2_9BACT|nr:MAG: hypothetical protein UR29_C0011G0026 [Candidatus Woesebacteria bacterium GW2011_GWC2_33_12]KKP41938.1 MAG: hypothetical protein UR33_C0007G0001 [Candidatus Woesebacteria bacterium GW2011_GWA2_33_20]KKP44625.1 MAG: hypothetical protein UR35_C0007G0041 [Candidatus Woesebacteria bacterium GW2011_GWB1_33_22]KKP46429.1 MAG: hypothetical protein UR37_C0008G0041 [Microgenomates group bacterium GW2011_GWC1_33_28]KKP50483.1 MAG: hypothetical protein UR41_C0007G0041 [Candidatus Woesebacteria bact